MHLPPDLFITNKPPNDEELFKAREAIKAANSRLETVQKMITELKEEEHTLLKTIEAYKNIASPLRRVPDDIIGEILLACTDVLPKVEINIAPLLFMRISRRIRQLALDLPRLWAEITIDSWLAWEKIPFDPVSSRRGKSYLDLVSQWLFVRSAAMPLKIRIEGGICDDITATNANKQGLLAILFQCKPRWQDVTVDFENDKPVAQFIANVNEAEPDHRHLRRLSVDFYDDSGRVHNFSGDGLLLAPNLTELKLHTFQPITLNPALLKWTKLTSLHISGSVNVLGPVLHQAPSLINLTINCVSEETGTEAYNAGKIRFPYLTNFTIMDDEGRYVSLEMMHGFFHIIDPPLLKTLKLQTNGGYLNEQSLSSLLSRIRCLEILTVEAVNLEAMPRILGQTPMLKELHITDCEPYNREVQNAFLDAFDNGHVCPHLQILNYEHLLRAGKETVDRFRRLRQDLHRRRCQR